MDWPEWKERGPNALIRAFLAFGPPSEAVGSFLQAVGDGPVSKAKVQHFVDVMGKCLLYVVCSKLKDEGAFGGVIEVPPAPFGN